MNCHEVYAWLLASRSDDTPGEVRRHLGHCRRCRARRRRLRRLEQGLEQLPLPTVDPSVKLRFLRKVERTALPRLHRGNGRLLLLTAATALLLGVGIGWLVLQPATPPFPVASLEGSPGEELEENLLARFVEHNLGLAGSSDLPEQLHVLGGMAADLRNEALRLARQGPSEDLPLVAWLYERVVRQGLVGRVQSLPPDQRRQWLPPLLRELRTTEAEVEQTVRKSSLAVADFLRPLSAAAQDVSDLLAQDEDAEAEEELPALFAGNPGTPRALLAVLVMQGLLLAEDSDPLRRTYYCNDLADHLALAILLASARGDHQRASNYGAHLNRVMDRGVAVNLARLRREHPQDARLNELEQAIARTTRALDALKKDLATAHSWRTLEATRYGRARDLAQTLHELEHKLREFTPDAKQSPRASGFRPKPELWRGPPPRPMAKGSPHAASQRPVNKAAGPGREQPPPKKPGPARSGPGDHFRQR